MLIPELGSDPRAFAEQILALSYDRPVMVALATEGERIEEIASNLLGQLPQRMALVGHGFGGSVALEIRRRAPDRVARMALIATSPLAETPTDAADRETRMIGVRAGRIADWVAAEFAPACIADPLARARIMGELVEMAEALGPARLIRQLRAAQRRPDLQSVLSRSNAPVAVLCGAEDPICPERRQEIVAGLAPSATLTRIAGAGHFPTLEKPEAVTAALSDFLAAPYVLRPRVPARD